MQSQPIHSVVGAFSGSVPGSRMGSYCLQMAQTHVSTLAMSWNPVGVAFLPLLPPAEDVEADEGVGFLPAEVDLADLGVTLDVTLGLTPGVT